MSTASPFFSVVIPTRNRAHLLRNAIQSALDQTFDDYEIIVSNNSSRDDTEEVAGEFASSGVRYVRTDRTLSMPDHWEFALDHARGRYVTYLCDDDALSPGALETVSDVIARGASRLLVLGTAVYVGGDWFVPDYRNCAVLYDYTGGVIEYGKQETYDFLATCQNTFKVPRMLNSFIERETLLRVRAQAGRIFLLCPDYSFGIFILTEIPSWTYIDSPLRLQGVFPEGIGAMTVYNRGEALKEFLEEFKDDNLLKRVPFKVPVVTSNIAETYLEAKEMLPAQLSGFEVDWESYFLNCWQDIRKNEENGSNVEDDKKVFFRVLSEQPERVRSKVLSIAQPPPTAQRPFVKRAISKAFNSTPLLGRLRESVRQKDEAPAPAAPQTNALRGEDETNSRVVKGEEAGFSNIVECARMLTSMDLPASVAARSSGGEGS